MQENKSLPRGCILGILSIVLGIILAIGSTQYQRKYYPVCEGGLSAGFPIVFICDDPGGSPISSWGKIDFGDVANVNPLAFILDLLLYSALLSVAWFILTGLWSKGLSQDENFKWGLLLSTGYLALFLFALMSFQSNSLSIEISFPRTPAPEIIIYTPTPFGTPPPPEFTPIPTTGP
jgi:hypothetical protein